MGNPFGPYVQVLAQVDTTQLVGQISLSPAIALPGTSMTALITFSEPVQGFTVDDCTVTGGTRGTLETLSNQSFRLNLTAAASGADLVRVSIAPGACNDTQWYPLPAGFPLEAGVEGSAEIISAPTWASATGSDAYGCWADLTVTNTRGSAVQRFRLIPPGTFTMGSGDDEPVPSWLMETRHQVTITEPFWIADTECSENLWLVVRGSLGSYFSGVNLPMGNTSWNGVQEFLDDLNNTWVPGLSATLPTEAQWEYAARAGTTSPFSMATVTTDAVNCKPETGDLYIPVGTYRERTWSVTSGPRNAWGLYNVHGNVYEYCQE